MQRIGNDCPGPGTSCDGQIVGSSERWVGAAAPDFTGASNGAGMKTRGSPWDGTPTSPLPSTGPHLHTSGWHGAGGVLDGTGRTRRRHRWLARITAVVLALLILGALALGGLLLVTPSVGDASARARALDAAHHVAYPGPAVPTRFAAALVATEDHRFYYEPGIDPIAIARYLWGRITGRPDQGGATLYVQLAKMLYTPGRSGLAVDAEVVSLGIKLYAAFPRGQILQMYADVAYFGHGYYGLGAASCGYFHVTPARLTWTQAAMLAGLVQAPSAYDPFTHLAMARAREAHVLGRLVATGKLTQAQANRAYHQPLGLTRGHAAGCAAR